MIKVGAQIRILRPAAMGIIPKGAVGAVTAILPNRIPARGNDMLVQFNGLGRVTTSGNDTCACQLNIESWKGHYEEVK